MLSKVSKNLFSTRVNFPRTTYIVAGKRTPIGAFNGKISKVKATDLGSIAVKGALNSINLDPKHVDEVILGNICSAGLG